MAEPLDGPLDDVLAVVGAHQLEGIIAKRLDSRWEPGDAAATGASTSCAAVTSSGSPPGSPRRTAGRGSVFFYEQPRHRDARA